MTCSASSAELLMKKSSSSMSSGSASLPAKPPFCCPRSVPGARAVSFPDFGNGTDEPPVSKAGVETTLLLFSGGCSGRLAIMAFRLEDCTLSAAFPWPPACGILLPSLGMSCMITMVRSSMSEQYALSSVFHTVSLNPHFSRCAGCTSAQVALSSAHLHGCCPDTKAWAVPGNHYKRRYRMLTRSGVGDAGG